MARGREGCVYRPSVPGGRFSTAGPDAPLSAGSARDRQALRAHGGFCRRCFTLLFFQDPLQRGRMSEAEGAQGRARRALTGTPDPDPRGPSTMRPGGEGGEPVPGRERGRATSETWEGPPARGWPLPAGGPGVRPGRPAAGRAPGRRHDAHSPRGPGAAFPEEDNRGFPHVSARPGIIRQPVLRRPSEPLTRPIHQEEL